MRGYLKGRNLWRRVMWLLGGVGVWLLPQGCEGVKESVGEIGLPLQQIVLSAKDTHYIDSAQILFFRRFGNRDSLWSCRMVYGITSRPRRYEFEMPAGIYDIVVLGNVSPDRVVSQAPYSVSSTYIDYQGMRSVPTIYIGRNRLNVGVDTVGLAGMSLWTAALQLTIRQVPANIERIEVDLLNTSSGVFLSGGFREEMQPPVSTVLTDVKADSSYTVKMMSFSSRGKNSLLEVRCYDANGTLKYRGHSASFPSQAGRRRVVSCSFEANSALAVKGQKNSTIRLIWENNEVVI